MTYQSEILADTPDVYWRLGETAGTVADDQTINGRDGTITGSPTLGVPGLISGDLDKAAQFGALTQYTISGTVFGPATYPAGATIEAALRVDALPSNANVVKIGTNAVDALALVLFGTDNTMTDSSTNANHGTYGADARDLSAFTFATAGLVTGDTCVYMNGDELVARISPGTFAGDFTVGCWLDDRGTTNPITLLEVGSASGFMVKLTYQNDNPHGVPLLRLERYYNYPSVQNFIMLGAITPGKHFITVVHHAATGQTVFYVDGVNIGAQVIAAQAMVGAETDGLIAASGLGTGFAIDEHFICPSGLNDAQVAALYAAAAVDWATWTAAVLARSPANFYHLDQTPGITVQFSFYDGATGWLSGVGYQPAVGEAHLYAGKYEDGLAKLYVDGHLFEQGAATFGAVPTVPATSYFKVASNLGTGMSITVDEAAFYSHAVSDARLAAHAGIGVVPIDKTASPVVRLVTARALVVPHQIQRWVLPIICKNYVETGPGEDIEQSQDVAEVRSFFVGLRRAGTPVLFQEGTQRHTVVVRDVSFPEAQVERWGIERAGLQGLLFVTVDAVDST